MPPVLIRYFPALTARWGSCAPHAKERCGPSITNQCQSVSGIYDAFLHSQQLELINPSPPPPKKHIKPQCTTVFRIRSFTQTLVLFYLSAKMHTLGKSTNTRNDVSFLSQVSRRASVITNLFMLYTEHIKISSLLVFHYCFF